MTDSIVTTLDCLTRLVRRYGQLLAEESRLLDLYLEGRFGDADSSRALQERLIDQVRQDHRDLRGVLQGDALSSLMASVSDEERTQVEIRVGELHRVIAELQQVIRRNRRFVHGSAAYCQGILQGAFSRSSRYDGQGFLQAPGSSLRGGMRA